MNTDQMMEMLQLTTPYTFKVRFPVPTVASIRAARATPRRFDRYNVIEAMPWNLSAIAREADPSDVTIEKTPFLKEPTFTRRDGEVFMPSIPQRRSMLVYGDPRAHTVSMSEALAKKYTVMRLKINGGTAMSSLPVEMLEMLEAVELVKAQKNVRNVLVTGLGLGILTRELLALGIRVTTLECHEDVISLNRDVVEHDKSTVVRTRAETYLRDNDLSKFDAFLLDHWSGTGSASWHQLIVPLRSMIHANLGERAKSRLIWCWQEDVMTTQIANECAQWIAVGDGWGPAKSFVRNSGLSRNCLRVTPHKVIKAIKHFVDPQRVGTKEWRDRWQCEGGSGSEHDA